jgi:hypothetical protein
MAELCQPTSSLPSTAANCGVRNAGSELGMTAADKRPGEIENYFPFELAHLS